MVAAEITSASAMAAAISGTTLTESFGRWSRERASASARAGVRFQISTRRMGRTAAWASIRCGAMAPAPSMSRVEASRRARYVAASAELAAVLRTVSATPSTASNGSPLVPSKSR